MGWNELLIYELINLKSISFWLGINLPIDQTVKVSQTAKLNVPHRLTVFKIKSEMQTCRTETQFFQNLYMVKKESLPDGPKYCGPALILKNAPIEEKEILGRDSSAYKLWVAWEVLRWLMKFRELCSGGFHPKWVTPPYHGFFNVNTPPNSQNSKRH